MLGRCLMSHLEGTIGRLRLDRPGRAVNWGFERSRDGVYGRRRLSVAPDVQRRRQTLNFIARLHHDLVADPRHRHPVLSAMFLAKNLLLPEYRRKMAMVDRVTAAAMPKGAGFWGAHLRNLMVGAPQLAGFSAGWFWRRHLVYRRIPYVALRSRTGAYPLDINQEQCPDPGNRVQLTDSRDRFGMRHIALQWRATDQDHASIAENCRILQEAFARSGVARYTVDGASVDEAARRCVPIGGHHIGTTRMSASAREGVVDGDCKVFGTSNLFVASASVFPTSGHANPTLTILALALRLADHLKAQARE
jgi:choline dehydrogenase-like flavoprotein